MVFYILGAVLYFILLPLTVFATHLIHKHVFITKPTTRDKKRKKPDEVPRPLRVRYKELMRFARRDKRDFAIAIPKSMRKNINKKRKEKAEQTEDKALKEKLETPIASWIIPIQSVKIFYTIYGLGAIATIVGFGLQSFTITLIGALLWYTYFTFGLVNSLKPVRVINRKLDIMYGIAAASIKYESNLDHTNSKKIKVIRWSDPITPQMISFELGPNLTRNVQEPFMQAFNLYFGEESTWVPSYDQELEHKGWDFPNGILHIYSVPPLPQKAKWSTHYVNGEGISWSWFPLGLGVEGGVEQPNPETNEVENVIGIDVSGLQDGEGAKAGIRVHPSIVASPQILIAGRTGGGKAIDVNELVEVIEP